MPDCEKLILPPHKSRSVIQMFDVPQGTKIRVGYYLTIPKVKIFLKEQKGSGLEFSHFQHEAHLIFEKDKAISEAKEYGLEVTERKVTTTTQIEETSIYKEEVN